MTTKYIYPDNEVKKDAPEEEVVSLVRLGIREDHLVTLEESGEVEYYLLSFDSDGRFSLCDGIPEECGLDVDEEGRVCIDNTGSDDE